MKLTLNFLKKCILISVLSILSSSFGFTQGDLKSVSNLNVKKSDLSAFRDIKTKIKGAEASDPSNPSISPVILISPTFIPTVPTPETFNTVQSNGLSFKPSPGDVSVIFLGNIFGIVDGVLSGTGSQITGAMFGVFNAAVLFIGGIILLYTLLVSTLNTSNDGQLAGQKWSSTWIPIRSIMGVALVLPKASGYCAMQIFIMFVVLQGIGAADSVWSRALDYLNRGGVIMQKQMNPNASASAGSSTNKILTSAMGIVAAQVCMQGLEYGYINLKKAYQTDLDAHGETKCSLAVDGSSTTGDNYKFCTEEVPDFMNSVIDSSANNFNKTGTVSQELPYFGDPALTSASLYTKINAICGKLSWSAYTPTTTDPTLSSSDNQMISNSRTIAVYQMYSALMPVSTAILKNSPTFNVSVTCGTGPGEIECIDASTAPTAVFKYGYPLKNDLGLGCASRLGTYNESNSCTRWGMHDQSTALLSGRELQDAVATYNGVMLPTLTSDALNSGKNSEDYKQRREFINGAKNQGWLLAGSYFFRLAILNNFVVNEMNGGDLTDSASELLIIGSDTLETGTSPWKFQEIIDSIKEVTSTVVQAPNTCLGGDTYLYQPLCQLSSSILAPLRTLITGDTNNTPSPAVIPDYNSTYDGSLYDTTVYAYLKNANSLLLPTQATTLQSGLEGVNNFGFNPSQSIPKLAKIKFSGGKWGIAGAVSDIMWNKMLLPVYNGMLSAIVPPLMFLFAFLLAPIVNVSASIFNEAISIMKVEGINPILALAQMGVQFIEGAGNSFIVILTALIVNPFSFAMFVLVLLLAPLVFAWMGILVTVGFTAGFYVPFVPLLVFAFASIGWFISVIEGMVAAPIVAIGILHPDGQDEVLGKADTALMLILNMFLRPSLMILGYIFGIALSYVGVWVLNAGFSIALHDISFMTPISKSNIVPDIASNSSKAMYGFWTNIMLYYFSVLTYVSLYMSIVQQAFELIHQLPDKTLRWISGGTAEQLGEASTGSMLNQVKQQSQSAADQSSGAVSKTTGAMQKTMTGGIMNIGSNSGGGESAESSSDAGSDETETSGSGGSG